MGAGRSDLSEIGGRGRITHLADGVATPESTGPPLGDDPDWISGRCEINAREVLILDPERVFGDHISSAKGSYDAV